MVDESHRDDHAWRVPVEQVIANGFNLDIKNPNVVPDELGDPVELLREYRADPGGRSRRPARR